MGKSKSLINVSLIRHLFGVMHVYNGLINEKLQSILLKFEGFDQFSSIKLDLYEGFRSINKNSEINTYN